MGISSYQEQIFYHYILENATYLESTLPDYFSNSNVREIFSIAKKHTLKYKSAPSRDQLINIISTLGLTEKYNNDLIISLYNTRVMVEQQEPKWLEDNVGGWIRLKSVEVSLRKAITFLKTAELNAENADSITQTIRNLIVDGTSLDLAFRSGSNFFDPKCHLQTKLARKSSGYNYVDLCLKGGYWNGSLIVFLGMPKAGKSMWLCNLAAKSVLAGNNTAYVTLELQEELVTMRIGANMLNVPLDEYEKLTEDQDLLGQKLNSLKSKYLGQLGELHIKEFPSSSASVNDIRNYLKKYEEISGIKFKNVFIDYLNIMKNWRNPNSENTYLKIKQLSEDTRAMGQECGWSIISVTQTNRSGWESSDLTLSTIAESAGLLHTVDVLFGIITNPEMKAKGEYLLKCMANRVNAMENTRKKFNINWGYARIEEDTSSQIEDMSLFINSTIHSNAVARGHTPKSSNLSNPSAILGTPTSSQYTSEINVDDDIITGSNLF